MSTTVSRVFINARTTSAAELLVILIAIGAIYLFLTNGGPTFVGELWAQLLGAP